MINASSCATNCNSYWAQGGIISRDASSTDTASYLSNDIMEAGVHLNRPEAVQKLSKRGPERVQEMLLSEDEGTFCNVPFERDDEGQVRNTS